MQLRRFMHFLLRFFFEKPFCRLPKYSSALPRLEKISLLQAWFFFQGVSEAPGIPVSVLQASVHRKSLFQAAELLLSLAQARIAQPRASWGWHFRRKLSGPRKFHFVFWGPVCTSGPIPLSMLEQPCSCHLLFVVQVVRQLSRPKSAFSLALKALLGMPLKALLGQEMECPKSAFSLEALSGSVSWSRPKKAGSAFLEAFFYNGRTGTDRH